MMHNDRIDVEAATHGEADDVQGYAVNVAAAMVNCVTVGMLIGWGVYCAYFEEVPLGSVMERMVPELRR